MSAANKHVRFVPCSHIEDVLTVALVQPEQHAAIPAYPEKNEKTDFIPMTESTRRVPATSFKEVK